MTYDIYIQNPQFNLLVLGSLTLAPFNNHSPVATIGLKINEGLH